MFLLRRGLYRITPAHLQSIRALTTNEDDFKFEPKFSTAEQTKILHIVNQANADELSKFDVTRGRIKNLEMWRMKNGPFRTLSDILEVEGLGVKVLERLCNSIILNKTNENNGKQAVNTNRRQFVTPTLDKDVIESIGSIVAIHLSGTGISWAKLQVENNELHTWNFQDFSFLPKKMLPTETYSLAVEILHQLPDADLYVMEASPSMSPQNPQSNKTLPTYTQNLELTSMLLALINSSSKHGMTMKSDPVLTSIVHNKVYYLRAFLSARLFKTLVGNERVASGAIIEKLLARSPDLPCTPIAPMAGIKETFASHSGVHKDLMGQALMLAISFMDLCVYKNPISLQTVNRTRRNT